MKRQRRARPKHISAIRIGKQQGRVWYSEPLAGMSHRQGGRRQLQPEAQQQHTQFDAATTEKPLGLCTTCLKRHDKTPQWTRCQKGAFFFAYTYQLETHPNGGYLLDPCYNMQLMQ